MTIEFKAMRDGAFVTGDTGTGLTSYAYPTSQAATAGRKHPEKTAKAMMLLEAVSTLSDRAEYDDRNWRRINTGMNPP